MPLLDRRTSAFLTRFKDRSLPAGLQWTYLSLGDTHRDSRASVDSADTVDTDSIEPIKDFLNQHYMGPDHPGSLRPFSSDDIQRLFLVDASWPESIKHITPFLSLAIISGDTRELVAVALVRPCRIRYRGVSSIIASIPVVCIHQQYRHSPLAAILLAKCYRQLRQYCLADSALFFGNRRPFHCLHSANNHRIDLQQQQDPGVYVKAMLSDYMMQQYTKRDAAKVIQLISAQNDGSVVYPEFNDTEYFHQLFRYNGYICSYCIFNMQRKLVGWFVLRKPYDADTDIEEGAVSLFAWAGRDLSAMDITYFALRQALLMKARYLELPYDMAFSDDDRQRLHIEHTRPQQAYSISLSFYRESATIRLFDPWSV